MTWNPTTWMNWKTHIIAIVLFAAMFDPGATTYIVGQLLGSYLVTIAGQQLVGAARRSNDTETDATAQ